MKKKIFIGIAMSLFAVATVFNMNISEQNNDGDVSLEAIEVMAQAQSEGGSSWDCYPWGWCCYVMHDGYPMAIQGMDNYGY